MHQTGNADLDRIQERYRALGLGERTVLKTFIDDMATAYADADLVVARAGALTLAELAIAGKPAILIPLPTAADDHQRKNAERFAHAGAALGIPLKQKMQKICSGRGDVMFSRDVEDRYAQESVADDGKLAQGSCKTAVHGSNGQGCL